MEPIACCAVLFGALLFSGRGVPSLSGEDYGKEGVCVEYVCYCACFACGHL